MQEMLFLFVARLVLVGLHLETFRKKMVVECSVIYKKANEKFKPLSC